jgi:hypothetical protein
LRDDWADSGLNFDIDSDGLDGNNDVGKEDRRVNTVAPNRLHRDLDGEVSVEARVQHRVTLAQLSVLGQRTPSLAHEPHRSVRHGAPLGRSDKCGVPSSTIVEWMIGRQLWAQVLTGLFVWGINGHEPIVPDPQAESTPHPPIPGS